MSPEEIRAALLSRRILTVLGDITTQSCKLLENDITQLTFSGSTPIHIIFDSGGGEVRPALHLYDAIRLFADSIDITGLVIGECSSSATMILLACSKRIALPHSRYMLHHIQTTSKFCPENVDVEEQLRQILTDSKRATEEIIAIYCDRCGCNQEEARQWMESGSKSDHLLYADEAKVIGLITDIVSTYQPITDLIGLAQPVLGAP